MSRYSPEKVAALLRRFGFERDRYVKLLSRYLGMGRAEFDALDCIEEAGELTPNQLSDRLGLTSGATTALIDRLEAAGQLTRSPHPDDRRSLLLRLTRSTDEDAAKKLSPYVRDMQAIAAALTDEERAVIGAFLEAAADAAEKNAAAVRTPPRKTPTDSAP